MANPQIYTWPKADAAAVCALQTTAGPATLLLNGTLATTYPAIVNFVGIARVVSLTSANDLSARTVTITGLLNGAVVSEAHAGPNANTVETAQLFNTVTSVAVDGVVTALSVGSGSTGHTNWFTYNNLQAYGQLNVACIATATINYSLQITNDDVQTVAAPHVFTPVAALTAATGSIMAAVTPLPIAYANIIVNSSSGNGAVVSTFIQQGLR